MSRSWFVAFLTVFVAVTTNNVSAFVPLSRSSTSPMDIISVPTSLDSQRSNDESRSAVVPTDNQQSWKFETARTLVSFGLALSLLMTVPGPALADGQTEKFKLPPIDKTDKTRCTLNSSTIGQANAARDKLYDLRECNLSGSSAVGFDLSGVIMTNTDVSKVNFQDAMFSKGYLQDSTFDLADFTNAIVDRANFKGSSLKGAIFKNTVLSGTSFAGADVEGADFTEAAFGSFDIKSLCKNPTLKGENPITGADTRETVGCGPQ